MERVDKLLLVASVTWNENHMIIVQYSTQAHIVSSYPLRLKRPLSTPWSRRIKSPYGATSLLFQLRTLALCIAVAASTAVGQSLVGSRDPISSVRAMSFTHRTELSACPFPCGIPGSDHVARIP